MLQQARRKNYLHQWKRLQLAQAASGRLVAGAEHTCGLADNGDAVCWGAYFHGLSDPPGGAFAMLASGDEHVCGIHADDGEAMCWGHTFLDYDRACRHAILGRPRMHARNEWSRSVIFGL